MNPWGALHVRGSEITGPCARNLLPKVISLETFVGQAPSFSTGLAVRGTNHGLDIG